MTTQGTDTAQGMDAGQVADADARTEGSARTDDDARVSPQRAPWWAGLRAPDGHALPQGVAERLAWYERHANRSRTGYYTSEVVILLLSVAVPAAAAMGAPAAVTGTLGAAVAASVGLRQLFRWHENWVRTSSSSIALQQLVVAWSAGVEPYAGPGADRLLSTRVEELVADDAAAWATLRSNALPARGPQVPPQA